MVFKIEIMCHRCSCAFELRPVEFKNRTSAECPNCGQTFPADVYASLKLGISALGSVPETTDDCANLFDKRGFSLRVKEFNSIFGPQAD